MTLPVGFPIGRTESYNAPLHSGLPAQLVPQFLVPLVYEKAAGSPPAVGGTTLPIPPQLPFIAANNYPQTAQPAQDRGFEDLVNQRARADLAAAFSRGGRGLG